MSTPADSLLLSVEILFFKQRPEEGRAHVIRCSVAILEIAVMFFARTPSADGISDRKAYKGHSRRLPEVKNGKRKTIEMSKMWQLS